MNRTRIALPGLALILLLSSGCTKAFVVPPGAEKTTVVGALLGAEHRIMGDLMTFGFPDHGMLRYREGYVLSYDGARRVPRWVAERLDAKRLTGPYGPDGVFYRVDPSIPAALSSRSRDYEGSGFVRGRMAAAANHPGHKVALEQTFYMSNVAPQIGQGFRQNLWVRLEHQVRGWAMESDSLYVVTGTLFLPSEDGAVSHGVIGESGVGVPTHFYKVLLRLKGKEFDMRAFLVPHQEYEPGTSSARFLTSVDEVERLSGLDFWRELSEPTQARLEALLPTHLWGEAPTEPAPQADAAEGCGCGEGEAAPVAEEGCAPAEESACGDGCADGGE